MKKKLILLFLLIVVFAAFVGVKFLIFDAQNSYGRLKIVSAPSASVFIENVASGKTPYDDKYKVGEYLVKLIPEGDATATASWQGKVKIYKNALTYINRELGASDLSSAGEVFTISKMEKPPKNADNGEVNVDSEPTGAIVYLDNDEKGVAPLLLSDVPKGDHELSIFMPGFFRRTQKINVTGGYTVNASFKLAIDQTQQTKTDDGSTTPTSASSSAATATPAPSTGKKGTVTISDTPTGFLRVRAEPSVGGAELGRVKPGETHDLLEEKTGWYRIQYASESGWISSDYATKN
jgi:hypothetical protein